MLFDTIKHELREKAASRRSAVSGTGQFPAKSWLIAVEERLDGSLAFVIHKNLEDGQEITHRLFVETGPSLLDVDSLVGLLRVHSAEPQGRTML